MAQARKPIRIRERESAWRLVAGPLAALAIVAVCEAADGTPFFIPNPASLMAIVIAAGAAYGGWIPGLVSALITLAYASWYFSVPGHPFTYTAEDFRKLQILGLALPSLAGIVGWLKSRAAAATRRAAESAAARDLQHVLEHADDAVFMADATGQFFHVNAAASRLTGYSAYELIGMRGDDLIDRASMPPGHEPGQQLRRDGHSVSQVELRRKDGSKVLVEIHAALLADGRSVGTVRDVTNQVRILHELREALALVTATLESTADGILVVDHDMHIVRHNERFMNMWKLDEDLLSTADDPRLLENVRGQLRDPDVFFAKVAELYAHPEAESFDTLEFIDGRVFERFSLPHRVDGRIVGRVWSFRDVTAARRQSEALRESEARFQQAQKLEAIGRLAGGVAHDFNNMLTAILGETELVLVQLPADSPHREQLEHIRSAAQRSAGLTRQLLAFGRRQPVQPRAVDLADVVSGIEPLVRRVAGPAIVFRILRSEPSPWVFADPNQLEQVLINLAINAHDAMPDGGLLTVRLGIDEVSEADRARRGARASGPHGFFEVSDTGVGIAEHVRPHLFEPFFTTKSPGKGTGLGLASAYGVVDQSGGFIEVDSRAGEGAVFRVLLPIIAAPQSTPSAPPAGTPSERHPARAAATGAAVAPVAPAAAAAGSGTILLAEDEGTVRTFVAAVLRQLGYRVLEAESGEAALALAAAHAGPIDLLLTDVVMPGKSGPEIALQLEQDRPGIRIVLMSGYAGDTLTGLGVQDQRFVMLAKPFGSDALARTVREALPDASRR